MLVPYNGCAYPEVLPEDMEQYFTQAQLLAAQQLKARQAVGLGCADCGCKNGMGDYLQGFQFPIPQHLEPGNPRGLGTFTMDGTGLLGTGLFSGGLDFSTWGAGEYITILGGIWVLYSVFHTTGQAASYAAGTRSRYRKRKAEGYRKLAAEYSKK